MSLANIINQIINIRNTKYSGIDEEAVRGFEVYKREVLKNAAKQKFPVLVNVTGIPGSGKSYYAERFLKNHKDYIFVSFDHIMENLPGYQKEIDTSGKRTAFINWEITARQLGYELLKCCIEQKFNILFEHSITVKEHEQLYQIVKDEYRYRLEIIFINADLKTALERCKKRERFIDENIVTERQKIIDKNMDRYRLLADEFKEINNGQ
ncbi:MAG: zeta toxin family protein [Rikenellaceae bacterium]|nr:zeta toxin family protein [Rikenellaceae bacterium]